MRFFTQLWADSYLNIDINACYLSPALGFASANRSKITVIE